MTKRVRWSLLALAVSIVVAAAALGLLSISYLGSDLGFEEIASEMPAAVAGDADDGGPRGLNRGKSAAPTSSEPAGPPGEVALRSDPMGMPVPEPALDGGTDRLEPEIEVVARAFLRRSEEIDTGYAFVGFLLFPNALSGNYTQRRAAAAAFLCLFEDTAAARSLGARPSGMAVFYAPVTDAADTAALLRTRDVTQFLSGYDYFRAELMAQDFALDIGGVYLVGFVPLPDRPTPGDLAELLVLDLTGRSPERIEAALLSLDREFSFAVWTRAAARGGALGIARRVFESLGNMLGVASAEAAPSECR